MKWGAIIIETIRLRSSQTRLGNLALLCSRQALTVFRDNNHFIIRDYTSAGTKDCLFLSTLSCKVLILQKQKRSEKSSQKVIENKEMKLAGSVRVNMSLWLMSTRLRAACVRE